MTKTAFRQMAMLWAKHALSNYHDIQTNKWWFHGSLRVQSLLKKWISKMGCKEVKNKIFTRFIHSNDKNKKYLSRIPHWWFHLQIANDFLPLWFLLISNIQSTIQNTSYSDVATATCLTRSSSLELLIPSPVPHYHATSWNYVISIKRVT